MSSMIDLATSAFAAAICCGVAPVDDDDEAVVGVTRPAAEPLF